MCSVFYMVDMTDTHSEVRESDKRLGALDDKVPQSDQLKDKGNDHQLNIRGSKMDINVNFETDSGDICKMFYNVEDVPAAHLVFLFGLQVCISEVIYFLGPPSGHMMLDNVALTAMQRHDVSSTLLLLYKRHDV